MSLGEPRCLIKAILEPVRIKAKEIPVFRRTKNGAVRICIYPLCAEADKWLGGLSNFGDLTRDIVDYEVVYAILPGGSRVINVFEHGRNMTVDCYSYSALKVADCSLAHSLGIGMRSGLNFIRKGRTEKYGYAAHRGALCVVVKKVKYDTVDGEPSVEYDDYCIVYVCVSGAKSDEDYACALEAISPIKDFFLEAGGMWAFSYEEPGEKVKTQSRKRRTASRILRALQRLCARISHGI